MGATLEKTPDYLRLATVNPADKASTRAGASVTHITPFDTVRPGTEYRADRALSMAEMANLAYDEPAAIERKLKKTGFQLQSFYSVKGSQAGVFNSVDTQCFVATKGDTVVLSFRGTDGLKDSFTDAAALFRDTVKVGPRETQVHRGFENALSALEGKARDDRGRPLKVIKTNGSGSDPATQDLSLHEEIRKLTEGPPRRKLYITGHSLGAALATIEGFNLAREGVPVESVYTIGSPRVGDPAFRDEYDKRLKDRTFRHVNYSDIVTRVPFDEDYVDVGLLRVPQWLSSGLSKLHLNVEAGLYGPAQYRHVGTEKYIMSNGQLSPKVMGLSDQISDFVDSLRGMRFEVLTDHLSSNYVSALKKLADAEKAAPAKSQKVDSFVTSKPPA